MKSNLLNVRNGLAVLFLSVLVTACGGGGGGGAPSDGVSPSPNVPGRPGGGDDGLGGGRDGEDDAVLTWLAPNSRTDGTCLKDLEEYRINLGNSPGVYEQVVSVPASQLSCVASGKRDACGEISTCTYTVRDLPSASWYFAVQAVDSVGNVSDYSNEAIKTITR